MEETVGVYCIINDVNNKVYVGSSTNIKQRINSHIFRLNSGTHDNKKLQEDWSIHKNKSFRFFTILECEKKMLRKNEQYYINYFNSIKSGYNGKDEISNQKPFSTNISEQYTQAINKLSESTGDNKRELVEKAFELLFKEFGVEFIKG